jgi:hypothetical protein
MLDAPPDPDDPASYPPGGELHTVAPSAPGATDQGALPNEIVRQAPPATGTDPVADPAELGRALDPGPRAPAGISLNEY